MNLLSKDELKGLAEKKGFPCISIYLPSHRGAWAPEIRQDQIRFKNLLRNVKEQLLSSGAFRNPDVAELTDPIHQLIDDDTFWEEQSEGIVLFRSPDMMRYYRLPIDFGGLELAVVNERFHIKPLIPMFNNDGEFFILSLSRNHVRLLKGSHFSIQELKLPRSVPTNMGYALRFEEREDQMKALSARPERGDKRTGTGYDPVFHGQELDEKNEILRYFQQIDRGLHEIFKNQTIPLILAGVDYLLPIYRQASNYKYIVDEVIEGNCDERTQQDLHERAWAIIGPYFMREQQKHLAEYEEYSAKKQAASDFKDIVRAAYQGRIDVLFVAGGVQRWGLYDPNTNSVHIHDERQPGDEDLLDFAATHTILRGGRVYVMDGSQVPDNGPMAAIFRYMKIALAGGGTKSKSK
jgi:hypothetical protein